MIEQFIKFHQEPQPVLQAGGNFYKTKTVTEKEFKEELEKAKTLYKVGDTVNLSVNNLTKMVITGFIERLEDIQIYQDHITVLYARNLNSAPTSQPIKYTMHEMNWDSLIPAPDDDITIQGVANDSCC